MEVRPRAPPVLRSDGSATPVFAWDRAEDLQAEARAMARAANATVYSPENLAGKYSSRPIQVQFLIYFFTFLLWAGNGTAISQSLDGNKEFGQVGAAEVVG